MHSIVTFSGVSFEFPNGRFLFQNLNFSVERSLTSLVGPNGIGKTTLAKLLVGELSPSQGRIYRHGSFTYFPQRTLAPEFSIEEFLGLENTWHPLAQRFLQGMDPQRFCNELSGGQWMRVRLARALTQGSYLVLDEPSNDLDREGRQALIEFLRTHQAGALLISHDRECLELCQDFIELSSKGILRFTGSWSDYEDSRDQERQNLRSALDAAKKDRDRAFTERQIQKSRQEKRNKKGAQMAARGGMPKVLVNTRKRRAQVTTGRIDASTLLRAESVVQEVYEAFTHLKIDPVMFADLLGQPLPNQKLVAEAVGFNIRFQNWIYPDDLHFTWRGNIRLALKGRNGSGKSTLLQATQGRKFDSRGDLRATPLPTLYLDQKCAVLDDSKSILENIRDVSSATEVEIRNSLARFLFVKDQVFQSAGSLSGGERMRATLAKGFLAHQKPELLILDEPTNNLDFVNIEFLENLVRSFPGALLVVSHDEKFLSNCDLHSELRLRPP